jgi:hypothetical protein
VIQSFQLSGGDQVEVYPVASGPLLTWSTSGAQSVEVWAWRATDSGLVRHSLLSTSPSGSLRVCPGTLDAGQCATPVSRYHLTIDVVGANGQAIASARPGPSFQVFPLLY